MDFSSITRRQRKTAAPTPSQQPSKAGPSPQQVKYLARLRASVRRPTPVASPADSTAPAQRSSHRRHLAQQRAESRRSSTRRP
jgi:hypothetical protein